jgi:hypothetical protein
MAKYTPPTKTSDSSCNGSLMLVAFRLGYLQATCNQILAKVVAMQAQPTAPPPSDPETFWSRLKQRLDEFETLQRAWRKSGEIYRSGPWGLLGGLGYIAGRKLGLW